MRALLPALLVFCLSNAPPARGQTVTICADPDPPPWTYWVRDSQNKPTKQFTGASVEMVRAAFARMGREINFIGDLPWARCMKSVAEGDVDFAMDAYFDETRAQTFAYSAHYNTLTPQVFFLAAKRPDISTVNDLKRFRGCGLIGASYAHYGLAEDALDRGVVTYDAMIQKLKNGRCDYFVEELEVISGFKRLGRNYLKDPVLAHGPITGAKAPAKHLIAAKNSQAAALLPAFNDAMTRLIQSGEAARIWKKHGADSVYRP